MTHFEIEQRLSLPNVRNRTVFKYTLANLREIDNYINWSVGLLPLQLRSEYIASLYRHGQVRNPPLQFVLRNHQGQVTVGTQQLPFARIPLIKEPHPNCFSKPAAVAIGPIMLSEPIIVNYRSVNNHVRGIIKRNCHDVQFNINLLQSFKLFVVDFIKKMYHPLPHIDHSHAFLDVAWLDESHQYTVKQKKLFHKLLDTYLNRVDDSEYMKHYGDKLYLCNSFIKREFYDEIKWARVINARPELFRSIVAPYIKEIERIVYNNKHFIKHKTPREIVQRMKEIKDKFVYVAETDYSSFEGSFTDQFQKCCEYQLFKYMMKDNKSIWKIMKPIWFTQSRLLLKTSRKNRDHVTFPGSRMSGEMWTSLGNGFTNMMLFLFLTKRCLNSHVGRLIANPQCDFLVEGDDGFFGFNYPVDLTQVSQLGFTLKINMANDINKLSFCGICMTPDGTTVPDFPRQLEKFGWEHREDAIVYYSEKITHLEQELMRAKSMSLLACAPGNPVLQTLALKVMELTKGIQVKARDFDWWERETFDILHMNIKPQPITYESRRFYEERFNISIYNQKKIEKFIKRQQTLRFIIPLDRKLLSTKYYLENKIKVS